MLLFLLFIIPIVAIISFLLIKQQRNLLELIAIVSAGMEFLIGMAIISSVIANRQYSLTQFFTLHSFEAIILGIAIIVGLIATLHSVGYLREEQEKGMMGFGRIKEYYILMKLFLMCMFVAIATTNPIIMWIAIEATTLSTVFLISIFNRKDDVEAAWKYLIINSIGLLLGLLGTTLFLSQGPAFNGFVNWNNLLATASHMNPLISKFAFVFILIGYGTKMGLVPMHTWRPDAYNKVPSPIAALLSGVLLNVAFLAILRFKLIVDGAAGITFSQSLFVFFGILSIVIAAFIIYTQRNYKRMLAYSSTEHAGIMMLGFGFGGIGIFGAILHMIYHSFAKSLLFFVSSNIAVKYSTSEIKNVAGMIKVMPYNSALYIIGFLTLVGIPPFGIFLTEFYMLFAGFSHLSVIAIIALFSLILVFLGFFKHVIKMLFGEVPHGIQKGEKNTWTIVPIVCFAITLFVISIYLPSPLQTLLGESYRMFLGK